MHTFKVLRFYLTIIFVFEVIQLYGQNISIQFKEVTLTKALISLSDNYRFTFAYDNALTDNIIVRTNISNTTIDEALDLLLSKTTLSYRRNDNVIVLFPEIEKIKKSKEALPAPDISKQTCQISGIVKDQKSGEQLPYASVYIPGTNTGTSTSSAGFFNLITRQCDSTDIVVSYIGYKLQKIRALAQGDPKLITILVNSESEILDEVLVVNKAEMIDNAISGEPTKLKFSTSRLAEMPSLSELDISAPLQLMPGIDGSTETSSGFLIRKSAADKNLILYDGFAIYQIDHFFGSFSSFNNKAIKDIQVYKGDFDARNGGRVGGVIEITGKSGNMYKPSFEIGSDMLAADAKLELPIVKDKLSFVLAGRRAYTDALKTPLYIDLFRNVRYDFEEYYKTYPSAFKNDENDPSYYFYDVQSKLTFKPLENQVFSLSYLKSIDNMVLNQQLYYPSVQEHSNWGTEGYSFRWIGNLGCRLQSDFVVGRSFMHNNFDHADTLLKTYRFKRIPTDTISKNYDLRNNIVDNSLNYNISYQFNTKNSLQLGAFANYFHSTYLYFNDFKSRNIEKNDTTRDYNKNSLLTGAYLQHSYDNNRLMFKSGFRLNHYSKKNMFYPEVRFQSSFKPTGKLLFKASYGQYHQLANKIALIKNMDYRSAWVVADNDNYKVVTSSSYMLGFNYKVLDNSSLDIEFYKRETGNLMSVYTFYKRNNNSYTQEMAYFSGKNRVTGMDVLLRNSIGLHQLWLAYTLSKSTNVYEKINNGNSFPSYDDQLHEVKAFGVFKLMSWSLSSSIIYGSGKTWNEAVIVNNQKVFLNREIISHRFPSYWRTDVGATYTLVADKIVFKTGLNICNLFNVKNVKDVKQSLSEDYVELFKTNQYVFENSEIYGIGRVLNVFVSLSF